MSYLGHESEDVEFKDGLGQLDKGIMGLTAMLNRCNHGTVYFGVRDDGVVIGTQVGKDTVEKIRNRISTLVEPQVIPDIDILNTEDGLEYLRVTVSGYSSAYSYNGRYYIRNVTSNVLMSPELLTRMLMSKGPDLSKEIPSPVKELTFSSFVSYLESKNIHVHDHRRFLENHGLINRSGEFNITAYLMSDQNNVPLQLVLFEGIDKGVFSSRTDFGRRSMLVSVRNMLDHVLSLQSTRVIINAGERKETPLFDMDAFREAWINACVHNDWRAMVPPSVFIYDDRLEIQSYGRIPFMLSLEEFYSGKSMPVNKTLFDLFILADYSEQSGHGIRTIVDRYGKEAIVMGDNIITVTIPFAFTPSWVLSREKGDGRADLINESDRAVLDFVKTRPYAKISQISEGVGLSYPTVSKIISKLKREGMLANDGTTRVNEWRVL